MKFEKEFKDAIANLPSKEKDKLLLRLLKKDLALANQLNFQFVSTDSVENRREQYKRSLVMGIKRMTKAFYSPGYLMMDIRELSGQINEHVSITKDKYGEILLNIFLLKESLRLNNKNLKNHKIGKTHKLYVYILNKLFKILTLINALHEDLKLEFEEPLSNLANIISENHALMQTAIQNGFDPNWLHIDNIPSDIKKIQKEIKSQGFLK